jgi:hypothetical protein
LKRIELWEVFIFNAVTLTQIRAYTIYARVVDENNWPKIEQETPYQWADQLQPNTVRTITSAILFYRSAASLLFLFFSQEDSRPLYRKPSRSSTSASS